MNKTPRHIAEAALLYLCFGVFSLMPAQAASAVGGFLGRSIGPLLAASRKAMKNLDLIYPDKPKAEKQAIIRAMWDNLGRVMAEYPHLQTIARTRTEVVNREKLETILGQPGSAIFIGGHVGNWELNGATLFVQFGKTLDLTYRAPNNPYADALLFKARTLGGKLGAFPKARETARKLVKSLQDERYLGIMIDQKFNTGIAVDFLGKPAMTNPAPFQLAQKFDAPLVPVLCERLPGCRFRMHVLNAIPTDGSVDDVALRANQMLSEWINKHPGQWLWLHRRWKSKALMQGS